MQMGAGRAASESNVSDKLATADVIQRRLGVDLGLGLGQPMPQVHSRQAADITRRVMVWASQYDLPEDVEDSRMMQDSRA